MHALDDQLISCDTLMLRTKSIGIFETIEGKH